MNHTKIYLLPLFLLGFSGSVFATTSIPTGDNPTYVRGYTDKRDIQIDYIKNQNVFLIKFVNDQKWLSQNDKNVVLTTLSKSMINFDKNVTLYQKIYSGQNQSYYESFSYFLDQYLGSIMRIQDSVTSSVNLVNNTKKELIKNSHCRSASVCNTELSKVFMSNFIDKSQIEVQSQANIERLILALEQTQNR